MQERLFCVVVVFVGIVAAVGGAGVATIPMDRDPRGALETSLQVDAGRDQTVNEGDLVQFNGHAGAQAGHWVRDARNPVFEAGPPGSWDDRRIEKHDVLVRDGVYHLWYTGYGVSHGITRIGYATSDDGFNWTRHDSNPVLLNGSKGEWDEYGIERVSVVWNGSAFLMWYNAWRGIGLATSPDGVEWSKYNDPSTPSPFAESDPVLSAGPSGAWDSGGIMSPSVLWNGTGYEMWYMGGGKGEDNLTRAQIGYAKSPDGIEWTKYDDPLTTEPLYAHSDPVLRVGPAGSWEDLGVAMPDVIIDEGVYKMWYTGIAWVPLFYEIGFATSPDGILWTKSPDNPVFSPGAAGDWDDEDVWTSKVSRVGSTLTMWYNGDNKPEGLSDPHRAAIGVAYFVRDEMLFSWDFDASVDADGDGNFTNDADATGPSPTHAYGDNGVYIATLVAKDSSGRTGSDTAAITVLNAAPVVVSIPRSLAGTVDASAKGSLVLRVAGTKWHEVEATVYRNGARADTGRIVRTPGSPDDQAAMLGEVTLDVSGDVVWSAEVVYTPGEDPAKKGPHGASPVWISFRSEHGDESSLHHTFQVGRRETWTWEIRDLNALLVGIPLDFTATAVDPGSDDLTFTWEWGDGTATASSHYNDGIKPDPYPSPVGTFPFVATDSVAHPFSTAGTYVLTVTVSDDDGGSRGIALTVLIPNRNPATP